MIKNIFLLKETLRKQLMLAIKTQKHPNNGGSHQLEAFIRDRFKERKVMTLTLVTETWNKSQKENKLLSKDQMRVLINNLSQQVR